MKIREIIPEDLYEGSMHLELTANECFFNVRFGSGEPEDMVLARDLGDALELSDMLIAAYEAGKRGEELEIIKE